MVVAVAKSLVVTTIVGFAISCDAQPMMRKRVVSSVIEVEGFDPYSNQEDTALGFDVKDNINSNNNGNIQRQDRRGLGRTWGEHKEEKYTKVAKALQTKGDKKSDKGDKKSDKGDKAFKSIKVDKPRTGNNQQRIAKLERNGNSVWNDLIDMSMSLVPSPTRSPTKPLPTAKPANEPTNGDQMPINQPIKAPTQTPEPTNKSTSLPTNKPTTPPTNKPGANTIVPLPTSPTTGGAGCESLPRIEVMKETLQKVTDSSILEDSSTPQRQAFDWIMDRDPARVDPCSYDTIEQRYALATFWLSTNGVDWVNSDGWLMESNECTWSGIECDGNGLVTELGSNGALIKNNLSGVLPQEIKVFKSLEVIQIGENAIEGSIPDVLTELTQLRLFDVEINSLSGPAIVNLEGLDQLESYRISANRFSGRIDPSIGDITSLQELWFADNQITGAIPETLGNLVNMETLYMYRNNLVGPLPATVGQMKKLRELQIFQNFLSGTIPEGLYSNTELGLVRLDRNQFTGTISESIGNLVKLGDLRIDDNLFTGKLPASFFNLSRLAVLRLNDNNFVGTIRDGFDIWKDLDFADFRNNGFEGTLPETIFDIPTIRILYFSNNNLDGTIPASYSNSPVLRDLFLSGNQLSGTIPDIQIGQLSLLTELLLEDNKFTGSMAESVCNLRASGQGLLEDLWVDCGTRADPRLECDVPGCCTACFPSASVVP